MTCRLFTALDVAFSLQRHSSLPRLTPDLVLDSARYGGLLRGLQGNYVREDEAERMKCEDEPTGKLLRRTMLWMDSVRRHVDRANRESRP